MSETVKRPEVGRALSRLKAFQRETVEYVFRRMYLDCDATRRFLVADEVGLGKTLVARGVIAKVIDHLWESVDRIDIVYICSNAAIARQNIARLRVPGATQCTLPSRITLLPTTVRNLQKQRLNFISLTPGTSFELRSSLGLAEERALLYWLLPEEWRAESTGAQHLLQGEAGTARFREVVRSLPDRNQIDEELTLAFQKDLGDRVASEKKEGGAPDLQARFQDLSSRFRLVRQTLPDEDRQARNALVGELRTRLATTCLKALEPDLIILDEFQRFKHLLDGTDAASQLASDLFAFEDARVLLLSATPYKMYTLQEEAESDDHFADFIQTVGFLQADTEKTARFRDCLGDYRRELLRVQEGDRSALLEKRRSVEESLRSVMVRTERLAVTPDRNGMLHEVAPSGVRLESGDVTAYLGLQKVARTLEHPDALEYWKSAPYLLNFMDEYQIKRALTEALGQKNGHPELYDALLASRDALLTWDDVEAYRKVDPGNARLRSVMADVIDSGGWQLLWIPPALPYYELQGPFANAATRNLTKRLVFSSWQVVPKVVATLLSYEVERRIFRGVEGEAAENTPEARKGRKPLLRLVRTQDGLTGMPVLALLYPSIALAQAGDPLGLKVDAGVGGAPLPLAEVQRQVRERVDHLLDGLEVTEGSGSRVDETWYWAAPILLDSQRFPEATAQWFRQKDLASLWRGAPNPGGSGDPMVPEGGEEDAESGWGAHLSEAMALLRRRPQLGRRPADLSKVLAKIALAGPGVVALRALSRVVSSPDAILSAEVRNGAGQVAWGLRSLFNLPETTALVRGLNGQEPYWERVLEYCADGCLQAVMDEYAHVLVDSLGVSGSSSARVAREVARVMARAVQLRTANLGLDVIRLDEGGRRAVIDQKTLRTRFAARFGGKQVDGGGTGDRQDDVRAAFNSPFWPFVLCSTSVGQEGLDFHLYCHAVVHWNLPSNPVDLEQREGRVQRYKGHAVRKNVAMRHGGVALAAKGTDPWLRMFSAARAGLGPQDSNLAPFWLYPVEGGARIERHILALPLSKDWEQARLLRRSLAVYRMAFGQSRQEDLMTYLLRSIPEEELRRLNDDLRIDLSPRGITVPAKDEVRTEGLQDDRSEDDVDGAALEKDLEAAEPISIVTLERIEELLDRFAALRGEGEDRVAVSALAALLDEFAAMKHSSVRA